MEGRNPPSRTDKLRRGYLAQLFKLTGRNTIVYYSSFQSKPAGIPGMEINDNDRDSFMRMLHGMDCKLGLDLVLHTPGGGIFATIAIVEYLRDKFGPDIRVFVPQTAMSAGTVIACAAKEIYMGKHSCIGPIDPQLVVPTKGAMPVTGLLEEFELAHKEIKEDPTRILVWGHILSQYPPSLLLECRRALELAREFTKKQLVNGMFANEKSAAALADKVIKGLTESKQTKQHGRPIGYAEATRMGLKIKMIEDDDDLQDAVLTIHHCYSHTLARGPITKLVENQAGGSVFTGFNVSTPPR